MSSDALADKYVKGPVVGKGTFGEVYKATNKKVRREDAREARHRGHASSAAAELGLPTPALAAADWGGGCHQEDPRGGEGRGAPAP